MKIGFIFLAFAMILLTDCIAQAQPNVVLKPANTKEGYIAQLLLNESPFPGERGWVSEENTQATMLAILWVCHSRIHQVPKGYRQEQIASVKTRDIIDVITAGGERGQCDGFYKDAKGRFKAVPRVNERIKYLLNISNKGTLGQFGRLMNYAQSLADDYIKGDMTRADRFAPLNQVGPMKVTGRAYSWMADKDYYQPGGNFIKIPDQNSGSLGGNRFFTLKEIEKK